MIEKLELFLIQIIILMLFLSKGGDLMLFEFWGSRACFTRPELKVERYSYDIPTPSALRGMISAIYWHPSIDWLIDRIYVLNPIRDSLIKRNEVNSIIQIPNIKSLANSYIYANQDREQRSSRILIDVHYVVQAHFQMTNKAGENDTPAKIVSIVNRRLEHGQCFNTPYLGCREFSCNFSKWPDDKEIMPISDSKDFGLMLYDLDYSDPNNITPMYYHAIMNNGVVDVSKKEVFR